MGRTVRKSSRVGSVWYENCILGRSLIASAKFRASVVVANPATDREELDNICADRLADLAE
jgi:hypothetical protein